MADSLKDSLIKIGNDHPDLRDELREILAKIEKTARGRATGRKLFPPKVYKRVRRALGLRTTPFFRFYKELREIYQGVRDRPEEGFYRIFRENSKLVFRQVDAKQTKDMLKNLSRDARRYFKKLDRLDDVTENNGRTRRIYSKIIQIYADMIHRAAKDQGVYLNKEKLKRPGWVRFTMMTGKELKLEKYKDMDEDLYEFEKEKNRL
jgi:hypothetical protein